MRMGEARKVVKKWVMRKAKRKLDALEMGILRSMCQLSLKDRIRNEEVRRRGSCQAEWITAYGGGLDMLKEWMRNVLIKLVINCSVWRWPHLHKEQDGPPI